MFIDIDTYRWLPNKLNLFQLAYFARKCKLQENLIRLDWIEIGKSNKHLLCRFGWWNTCLQTVFIVTCSRSASFNISATTSLTSASLGSRFAFFTNGASSSSSESSEGGFFLFDSTGRKVSYYKKILYKAVT